MLGASRLAIIALLLGASPALAQRTRTDVVYEASIPELQAAMAAGRTTAVALVDAYLARIAAYDHRGPSLNAIIRINPLARANAAALDAERKAGTVRGPLHGIPVILKDNYATRDMPTSGGSIALADLQTPDDAFQVRRLRDAGAIILAKSNLHELAAGITSISSFGGQTCNPYDPDRYPGGSSGGSGAAVAASFAAVAFGSDTCGSIRTPSAVHNLFGLRPTKGLSSITGIVPLSHTQDVGGPMARTVMDLAIALDATIGPDGADSATRVLEGRALPRFVASLDSTSLRGTRIGVLRSFFGTEADDQEGSRVVRAALDQMKSRGAEIIEIATPGLDTIMTRAAVIDFEFKFDLLDFLAQIPNAPVRSLGEILERGLYHTALEAQFRRRELRGTRDGAPYRAALANRVVARDTLVALMDVNRLDALAYPTLTRKAALIGEPQRGSTCSISAVSGLPALSIPAGFTPDSLPIGVELLGRSLSDARLVAMAYDYEQSSHPRRAPATTPPLVRGTAPAPVAFTAVASGSGGTIRGTFSFDVTKRALDYDVRVANPVASRVRLMSLSRDSAGHAGPVVRRLGLSGSSQARGTLTLNAAERADLMAGRLSLVVHTAERTGSAVRAPLRP